MIKELPHYQESLAVKENLNSGRRLLVVYESERGRLEPLIVSEKTDDLLVTFLLNEKERVSTRIEDLRRRKSVLDGTKSHTRSRSKRERGEIREGLIRQINQESVKLDILEGRILQPLVIEKEGGEMKVVKSRPFGSSDETVLWHTISQNSEVVEMIRKNPKTGEWIAEAVEIGANVRKHFIPRNQWDDFVTKDEFSELDDEHPIFQVFMEVNKVFIAKL